MDRTILLVDDEEDIRDVLEIYLSDYGYRVLTAADGAEALKAFEAERPGLVLSDIKMPGMDGIELLQKIKSINPDAEVIMITGHGDMNLAVKSLKHEATDFITKPINDDALEIALKRAEERMCMRRKLREYTENLEQLVEEKTRRLLEAERMAAVGETIASLSHAIKNIASGLKGGAFVVEKGIELDDKNYLLQGWNMVKGNVEKIKNLSLDLLNYGKAANIRCGVHDPNAPVREAVQLMASRAEENGVALTADLDETLPPAFLDPEGVHRCLLNLITNAIDACLDEETGSGSGTVTVKTLRPEGWAAAYEVADTGCGMDEETRKNLFRSFFSTKGARGTGVGLMTTKKIVDQHGGEITVASEKGAGSTFTIKLPAQ